METFGQGDGTRLSGLDLEGFEQAVGQEANEGTTTSSIINTPGVGSEPTRGLLPDEGLKDDIRSGLSQEQIFQLELWRIEMQREIKEQEVKSLLELQKREMEACLEMMSKI